MLLHRAIAPFLDSTVVTTGKLRSTNGGHGSSLSSPLGVLEHFRWSRLPQSENISRLVHVLSEVWGCDSTVVTIGKFRSTNGGHGSMLSPLGVLERFRWTRLPQSENISRLVHVPSEVWGCRRIDAGVDRLQGRTPRIGTGVADILRKPSGTFHPLYTVIPDSDRESIPWDEPLVLSLSKHVLSSVEGCERGRPTPGCTSRQSPPPPIYHVIPRPREGSQAPVSRHGIHRPSPPSNFRECKGYNLPFLKQSKPCLKPQNNQNPPPPPRHSRLRSGIHPEGLGRVPVGATGWSPFPVRNAGRGSPSPSPAPRAIPRKTLQASFNQTSYEFNQRSINVQSKTRPHNRIETRCVAPPTNTSP